MGKKNSKQPRLQFVPFATREGLGSIGIGQYRNKGAFAAIRELIQNSLDAAGEAGNRPAIVRFVVSRCERARIPGIDEYERAFQGACDFLHKVGMMSGNDKNIADAIKAELKSPHLRTLQVFDNGIGLDDSKMTALLGDGASDKKRGAGSHGVGHYTAFGLSCLRYILYGGVRKNGEKTAAGHAILASHDIGDRPRGKDGYYLVDKKEDLFMPYEFAKNGQIPSLLKDSLDSIQSEFSSGSVVTIAGFNFFGEQPNEMRGRIEEVAAQNFFPAIYRGDLKIEIVDEAGEKTKIGSADLEAIINRVQDQLRAKERGFPSGRTASESYHTLTDGKEYDMSFNNGKVKIYIRQDEPHKNNIALCRNGMWITDAYHPFGKFRFASKVRFDALLLVDDKTAGKIERVIRDAENPLHNEIDPNLLEGNEGAKKSLREFCDAVRKFLSKNVKDFAGEDWSVDDFLSVQSGQSVGESLRGGYKGGATAIREKPTPTPTPEPGPRSPKILPIEVHRIPRKGGISLLAIPDCDYERAEVRISADGGSDESCAGMQWDYLPLRTVRMGGTELELSVQNDRTVGFFASDLRANQAAQFDIELDESEASEMVTISCEFRERLEMGGEAAEADTR